VNAIPFPDEENYIRGKLESLKHVVGDQIVYGPDHERGTTLSFGLDGSYRGMAWRSVDQRQSRKSLAKGYYTGLNERGDLDEHMEELLKLRASTLKKKMYRAKKSNTKSQLTLARKLALKIDKRSEKLLAGIDHLCGILHRPPAKFEIEAYLKMSWSTLSEGLCDIGFDWLPVRKSGPKKVSKSV
jgi:hypothetical protein